MIGLGAWIVFSSSQCSGDVGILLVSLSQSNFSSTLQSKNQKTAAQMLSCQGDGNSVVSPVDSNTVPRYGKSLRIYFTSHTYNIYFLLLYFSLVDKSISSSDFRRFITSSDLSNAKCCHTFVKSLLFSFIFSELMSTSILNYGNPCPQVIYIKLCLIKVAGKQQKRILAISLRSKKLLKTPSRKMHF